MITAFEYTILQWFQDEMDQVQSDLNQLGSAGWRLVSVTDVLTGYPSMRLMTAFLERARYQVSEPISAGEDQTENI